jgi:hypothetical protein
VREALSSNPNPNMALFLLAFFSPHLLFCGKGGTFRTFVYSCA